MGISAVYYSRIIPEHLNRILFCFFVNPITTGDLSEA